MKSFFDFLIGPDDDLVFTDGDLTIGESTMQEVGIILRLNQAELKSDPVLGPNLLTEINGPVNLKGTQAKVKTHLARDNKDYDEIKNLIGIKTI